MAEGETPKPLVSGRPPSRRGDGERVGELERVREEVSPEIKRLIDKFLSLPEEQRMEKVMKFLGYVEQLFRDSDPVSAGIELVRTMASFGETIVYFLYMWRPEFQELALNLLAAIMEFLQRS